MRNILIAAVVTLLSACTSPPVPPTCDGLDLRPLASTPAVLAAQTSALEVANSYDCGDAS